MTHWCSPADEWICHSKIQVKLLWLKNLASGMYIYTWHFKVNVFLVQQRDSKQTFSEKFQILEQTFESKPKWEREKESQVWKRLLVGYPASILFFPLCNKTAVTKTTTFPRLPCSLVWPQDQILVNEVEAYHGTSKKAFLKVVESGVRCLLFSFPICLLECRHNGAPAAIWDHEMTLKRNPGCWMKMTER